MCLPLSAMAGGGWTHPKGEGYFKLGQSAIRTNTFYTGTTESVDIITTSLYTTSIFGEYGLADRITAIGYVPYVRSHVNALASELTGNIILEEDQFNAFGDLELGLKFGLLTEGPIVVSGSIYTGVPTGKTGGGNSGLLQTGDGELNQLVRLDASSSWNNFYASAYTGFNNRTQDFSEELRAGAEIGYFNAGFLVDLKYDMIHSFKNGSAMAAENGLFANNMEHRSITGEVGYIIKDLWGLTYSSTLPVYGRNVLNGAYHTIGLVFLLKDKCEECPGVN